MCGVATHSNFYVRRWLFATHAFGACGCSGGTEFTDIRLAVERFIFKKDFSSLAFSNSLNYACRQNRHEALHRRFLEWSSKPRFLPERRDIFLKLNFSSPGAKLL
ncbi:hypothetical protein ACFE04_019887 [Oxalis oulophora]